MFADLPVSLADPVERLATVRAQMQDLKESHQAVAGSTLTSLGGFAPAMLLALAGRVATRTPQHAVNTVTTNVPGPQHADLPRRPPDARVLPVRPARAATCASVWRSSPTTAR